MSTVRITFPEEPDTNGWARLETPYWGNHVVPINDGHNHTADSTCECGPRVDLEDGITIFHNSFDGREALDEVYQILNGHV